MKKSEIEWISPHLVKLHEPFKAAFRIDPDTLKAIEKSMSSAAGYDAKFPLLIWKEKNVLYDGHSRLTAAKNCRLPLVPVLYVSFPDEAAVWQEIQRLQLDRRNVSDADKLQLILNDAGFQSAKNKKSFIAERLHVSERTAARFMAILNNPQKLKSVLNGGTVSKATRKEKTESPIIAAVNRLSKILDTELTDDEAAALDALCTEARRVLRSRQKTA